MRRLLITAFGPFPGVPRNPSATLARLIAQASRLRLSGIRAEVLILPTVYKTAASLIHERCQNNDFDAVLMLGVAARRRHLSIETQAINRASLLFRDAEGQKPDGMLLSPAGPHVLHGHAPFAALKSAAKSRSVRTKLSRNAGRYLCNASYYWMLERLPAHIPCVFVHIPMPLKSAKQKLGKSSTVSLYRLNIACIAVSRALSTTKTK